MSKRNDKDVAPAERMETVLLLKEVFHEVKCLREELKIMKLNLQQLAMRRG